MKKIKTIIMVLSCLIALQVGAETRQNVELGIQKTENLISEHKWHEAFQTLREMDSNIGSGQPELHYLISKQRFRMYFRINKNTEAYNNMVSMEKLAYSSGDKATIEDMLKVKAGYYSSLGKTQVSQQCYKELLAIRSKGKKDAELEECFKSTIAEARQQKQFAMANMVQQLFTAWQDSIADVRNAVAKDELERKYAAAQEDIDSKATKITAQWVTISILAIIVLVLAGALAFFIFLKVRGAVTVNNLRKSLEIANTNSENKSLFIRNISGQISPSLDQIAKGNAQKHIDGLRNMFAHVEEYMALESSREQRYETEDTDVEKVCQEIASKTTTDKVPVTTEDTQKISFPLNKDAVEQLITSIINEMCADAGTSRISIKFKKRNPKTGNFIITAVGMKIPEEDRDLIFTAFAKIHDLTVTDGLALPTCALMAYKMGSSIHLDTVFAKGTRIVLEVHK